MLCPVKVTVTSKGQITIPVKIRRKLGLKTGSILDFDESAPVLTAKRVLDWDAFCEFGNGAKDPFPGMTPTELLDELRGPVEFPPESTDDNRD